jgi:hypothetical protein
MTQRSSATCGLFLLLLGMLLLLATTGLIQVDFWGAFIPLLMIAFGGLTRPSGGGVASGRPSAG